MGGRWLFPFPHGWQWCVGILGPEVRSTRRPANKADRWESSGKNPCDSMENPTLRIWENHPMTCKWLRTIASFRGKSKDRGLGPLLFMALSKWLIHGSDPNYLHLGAYPPSAPCIILKTSLCYFVTSSTFRPLEGVYFSSRFERKVRCPTTLLEMKQDFLRI